MYISSVLSLNSDLDGQKLLAKTAVAMFVRFSTLAGRTTRSILIRDALFWNILPLYILSGIRSSPIYDPNWTKRVLVSGIGNLGGICRNDTNTYFIISINAVYVMTVKGALSINQM